MFSSALSQSQQTMYPNNSNSQNQPWYPSHPINWQSFLPMHPNNNPQTPTHQQPLPSPPFVDPNQYIVQQQVLGPQAYTPPWGEGSPQMRHYHVSPYGAGPSPVNQGVAQQYQHQYRPPRPGPSRRHIKGGQKMEVQYQNSFIHASSGMISWDHSIGIHPANAQMGAFNNTGTGGAWRPPSENPMVNHNSTQQVRPKPYKRDRAARSWTRKERTDKVEPSMYKIPITGSGSKLI